MKFLTALSIAAAMLAVPAITMAKDCGDPPAKPQLPDGASASEAEMKAAQAKFTIYAQSVDTYIGCLSDQMKAVRDEYEAVTAHWTSPPIGRPRPH